MTTDTKPDTHFAHLPQKMPYAYHGFGLKRSEADTLEQTLRHYTEKLGPIAHMRQVHGDRVSYVSTPGMYPECDAIYTDRTDVWLAVATADCVPVLVSSPAAVAAVHCGWRGLKKGILTKTLNVMLEEFDLSPTELFIGIGPCIQQQHYEVDGTFAEDFDDKFLRPSPNKGKLLLDMPSVVKAQAKELGINDLNILNSDRCTFSEAQFFHSYRRSKKAGQEDYSVQLSLIRRQG